LSVNTRHLGFKPRYVVSKYQTLRIQAKVLSHSYLHTNV